MTMASFSGTFSGSSRSGKADILRGGPSRVSGPFPKNADNRSFQSSWYDRYNWVELLQELSYRKQIAHQRRTQYVDSINSNPVILKSRLRVTQVIGNGTIG